MSDVLTPQQRSYCMSQIRRRDTKPEMAIRRSLWRLGVRYRVKNKLAGKPDIVFPGKKLCIFIDGCFWHKCPDHFQTPKTNTDFWVLKIEGNVERDRFVNKALRDQGWKVLRFWEHDVKASIESVIEQIIQALSELRSQHS